MRQKRMRMPGMGKGKTQERMRQVEMSQEKAAQGVVQGAKIQKIPQQSHLRLGIRVSVELALIPHIQQEEAWERD